MGLPGKARKVTIFVGQPHGGHRHVYLTVMERLKAEGAAGATAFKAIAAFGARSAVERVTLSEIVPDLPVMIVWIDTPDRVERILPHIQSLVTEGLIAVEDTDVTLYTTGAVPDLPTSVPVREVMTRDVVAVNPDTPMAEVVRDLLERHFRSVPVVDAERHVLGIITNGDLVQRGGLPVRLELLRTFDVPRLHDALERLSQSHHEAQEIMTSPVVTVPPDLDVRHAAAVMCRRTLKRLPVVDAQNRLVGMVSRADLLRAVAEGPMARQPDHLTQLPAGGHSEGTRPISGIMSREVPRVRADAGLPAVVDAVLSTRLNRAVVVDDEDRVLGVVTDSELVDRLTPQARPGMLASLMERIPFVHPGPDQAEALRHARGNVARDLMTTDVVVAREDDPIRDVLGEMLHRRRKIVPVVNGEGKLVGIVDRADLLGTLV